ncbi:MAG: hypothetical protein CR972_03055 [Candidatus Moraniibacteriota bacterium]|nr:MAG: hypothetical protein CR972_03055 [Candidatus Moranbacteria bacterium]
MIVTKENDFTQFQLYLAIRSIANLMFEYASAEVERDQGVPWLDDRRDESVNPFYNQIKQGVFLEMYYSQPGKIWTPWGCWNCWGSGSGSWNEKLPEIFERLGVTVFKEKITNEMGVFGPVYSIHKIDDQVLPEPIIKTSSKEYISFGKSCEIWEDLTNKYYALREEQAPASYKKRSAMDQLILEARGKKEPFRTKNDILCLEDLENFRGKVVKYTKDGGKTWHYAKLHRGSVSSFSNTSAIGYRIDEEVMPNVAVHCTSALTDKDFDNGLMVRPTTSEEIENIRFSYENLN